MTVSRRLRSGPLVAIATATAVAALFALPAPKANAFLPQNHEKITRAGLPAGEVSEAVFAQIMAGPPPGAGVAGSEAFQLPSFRHFDSAATPADVCTRANDSWNFFIPMILSGSQQVGTGLSNGPAARAAFGGFLHSVQDFFSHSNWVELNVAAGNLDPANPPLFPTCDPAALPAGLYTGYYDLALAAQGGCPTGGPPPPFAECHTTLNKDDPNSPLSPRGSQLADGTNIKLYDVAAKLAANETTEVYQLVRTLVANTNGESAAVMLFQGDGTSTAPTPGVPSDPYGRTGK